MGKTKLNHKIRGEKMSKSIKNPKSVKKTDKKIKMPPHAAKTAAEEHVVPFEFLPSFGKEEENSKLGQKKGYEVVAVKKLFTEAAPHNQFFVSDGSIIKNVAELVEALEKMHEDTYKSHANEQKNDFGNWVKDVFGQHELAENLKSAASKADAQLAVAKTLLKELL